jgi:hypothetical protein
MDFSILQGSRCLLLPFKLLDGSSWFFGRLVDSDKCHMSNHLPTRTLPQDSDLPAQLEMLSVLLVLGNLTHFVQDLWRYENCNGLPPFFSQTDPSVQYSKQICNSKFSLLSFLPSLRGLRLLKSSLVAMTFSGPTTGTIIIVTIYLFFAQRLRRFGLRGHGQRWSTLIAIKLFEYCYMGPTPHWLVKKDLMYLKFWNVSH